MTGSATFGDAISFRGRYMQFPGTLYVKQEGNGGEAGPSINALIKYTVPELVIRFVVVSAF